jgi:hypothetical protein
MNAIVIDKNKFGMDRDTLEQKLKEKGIETRRFFIGMDKQQSLINYECKTFEILNYFCSIKKRKRRLKKKYNRSNYFVRRK